MFIISKLTAPIPPTGNLSKLNKIVESGNAQRCVFTSAFVSVFVEDEDDDDNLSTPNTTVFIGGTGGTPTVDSVTTTSGILRSKDLRSVVEKKRRNFSRSQSGSDSEDNGSVTDTNRSSARKPNARSPTRPNSYQESNEAISGPSGDRGRSLSNIENLIGDVLSQQQQLIGPGITEAAKRRSFSRASSIVSNNRLTLNGITDELNHDLSTTTSLNLMNDRARSLSTEHRLANPSQMSIASRTSIRYSTPRESTVFTKTDAPPVVRLLQQTPHHDTSDAIRTIIEHQRSQLTPAHHEHVQTPVILEEEVSSPTFLSSSMTNTKSPVGKASSNGLTKPNAIAPATDAISLANGHSNNVPSPNPSQQSLLSTLKYSLLKHQQQQKSNVERSTTVEDGQKSHQQAVDKHRVCCTII